MWSFAKALLAGLGLILLPVTASAADPSGSFGVVSDIHFDPFQPPQLARDLRTIDTGRWSEQFSRFPAEPASQWGSDTNFVLLQSALGAIAERLADVDFVIYPGDLLSHSFETDAASAFDVAVGSVEQRRFAERTARFVIASLTGALPDKPLIVALGNTDSECGDYEIEPGGEFLAETAEFVRNAAGSERVAADFNESYRAGGYYALRHPTVENGVILVLNDILWSRKYANRCGGNGQDAARLQLQWLRSKLAEQAANDAIVWIVHHIPWGIDAYSTLHSKARNCRAGIVPFLREDVTGDLVDLLRSHAGRMEMNFSGHIHSDDFRLLLDKDGQAVAVDKIVPAISPVFGQNPGFQLFTYDVRSGKPLDYVTYYLSNLSSLSSTVAGDWRQEYVFSEAYGETEFSVQAVARVWKDLARPGLVRDAYRRDYNQRHKPLSTADLPAYACAIANLDVESFAQCHCAP
ncbi:metallophosphoesterase [Hoeflea sp. WL0058]|uniref:Metallophosphoesterase n=1 Tax=Flavimaribacter sediminis TaxID=2865987 RepID=A0AAE2ZNB7_9HYPH|nr:metallophosphoesterase [Flavimaribacter sediminis]MBW8640084.1 metallophosphoesterase [Flavimaribacter sediminis]